jgi:photosystem I P700 chlorophyll a apoprotein A1
MAGSCCIAFAHHMYAIPMYPSCASDYPTVLSLFSHHIWVGGILTLGAGAHASIFFIPSFHPSFHPSHSFSTYLLHVLKHRDVILGHLLWVSIGLGFHSFSLYIHNDSFQGFGRPEDIFHDNSIQLKPVFALAIMKHTSHFDMQMMLGEKSFYFISQELGTADLIVHHIHAFTIHVALLIFGKGILYARNSRLMSDKLEKGFRYPCDGPGRGGTCQISAWDHISLSVFWMYNSFSGVLFHSFWKMQSDVWGIYIKPKASFIHISSSDYSLHSAFINGWLRNFLWSSSAQGIQSYATSISGYGLIFILDHFVWAFSLMFLYSGRGYWQEFIESILWAHHTLKIIPHIQPRALSISQGRAVGFIHYVVGGVGCTWAFVISRMVVLT